MKKLLILIALTIFLIGCVQTEIVSQPTEEEQTVEETTTEETVTETPAETTEGKIGASCTDTEVSHSMYDRGTVSGSWTDGTTYENEDDCIGGVYLVEWYCDGDSPASTNYRCETECKRGVCV